MASGEGVPVISVENDPNDDTSSSSVASKSSVDQGSLSARSSVTSLALQDAQKLTLAQSGSIKAEKPVAETETKDAAEEKKSEGKDREDKFDADSEENLHEQDDPKGDRVMMESLGVAVFHKYKLNSRRKKAALRLNQSKAYSELIEDRILDLEKKVRALRKEKTPEPEKRLTNFPSNEVDIEYQSWEQFSARLPLNMLDIKDINTWEHRPEIDPEPKRIIEVLQEAPFTNSSSTAKNHRPSEAPRNETVNLKTTDIVAVAHPHLIRIRSRLLLKVIKKVTGCDTVIGPHKHRLLLFQPYKLFVKYATDLRSFLEKLERENGENAGTENSAQASNVNTGSEMVVDSSSDAVGPKQETHTQQARDELRLLLKVIDAHLRRQIALHDSLSPETGRVKFVDLWHIFKPGYEIRSPGASQIQLYRIILVSGGRDGTGIWDRDGDKLLASKKLKDAGYSTGSFIIEAFYLGFDGTRFGPVNVTFQIRKFESEKDITDLPVYPIVCDPNHVKTREAVVKRGQAFADLSNPNTNAHRKYKGLTLGSRRQEHVESEVIIDFQLAFTAADVEKPTISSSLEGLVYDDPSELVDPKPSYSPCGKTGCCGNDIIHFDYNIDEEERKDFRQQYKGLFDSREDPETLTDDHKALLPPQAHGFVLRTRKWATLDIDLLEPPDYDDGWKNLVIDQDIKNMVLALVENHERPHGSQSTIDGALPSVDLVQGKGRGLIILLHGEPGVGKTSTAECVASHTKRPLFPITCGDIGEKAADVEDHLEKNFQLAHKWGCVLLLDEADVFLGKRGTNDIQRNAIVSVFLRTLEYYSGILFLTTNRVGKIDRAFKSRIHLSLFYPKLDEERTLKIWGNNLDRVTEDVRKRDMTIGYEVKEILDFAREHFRKLDAGGKDKRDRRGRRANKVDLRVWNGRQIRNAFQTAIAIAKYEAKDKNRQRERPNEKLHLELSQKQFRNVASIAEQFDEYLNELYGKNDADLAKNDKTWVDSKDVAGQKDGRKASRDRDREEEEEERRRKRKRNESLYDSEDSDESEHWSNKKADRRGRRRSRS